MTQEQRQQAIRRIQAKRGFQGHLAIYLAVNALLVAIWAFTGAAYFWPIWPILGWGIGVVLNGVSVYARPQQITEAQIDREMQGRLG